MCLSRVYIIGTILAMLLIGCSTSQPRTWRERYQADPAKFEEAVEVMLKNTRQAEYMARFKDPAYFELEAKP